MKINKDGFVWKIVTDKAKEIFSSGLFELYILHSDDSETLIENVADLDDALSNGLEIGIEVGRLEEAFVLLGSLEAIKSFDEDGIEGLEDYTKYTTMRLNAGVSYGNILYDVSKYGAYSFITKEEYDQINNL
jgi:hypothetical protein